MNKSNEKQYFHIKSLIISKDDKFIVAGISNGFLIILLKFCFRNIFFFEIKKNIKIKRYFSLILFKFCTIT